MIESIRFKNFKALRDCTLPLGPCTILVGPNGSGKSTVLQALEAIRAPGQVNGKGFFSVSPPETRDAAIEVGLNFEEPYRGVCRVIGWNSSGAPTDRTELSGGREECDGNAINGLLQRIRVYSFDANAITAPVAPKPEMELERNGAGLAGVLSRLQDLQPERFESLNTELCQWLPEFDRLLLDLDGGGRRLILFRTQKGQHKIPARDLSQGTLIALAILTLAHLPDPPALVGLEEPDRGIHPYLLRHVQDALYHLSYPESHGENRPAVQVIATTHSPSFLNLFGEYPEKIVVANKVDGDVQFQRMTDQPHFKEILGEAALGEAWFTGFLGGVPSGS